MSTEKLMSTEAPMSKVPTVSTPQTKLPITPISPASSAVYSRTAGQNVVNQNIATAQAFNIPTPTVKTPQLTTKQMSELDTASARIEAAKLAGQTPSATDIANVEYAKKNKGYTYTPKTEAPIAPTPTPPTGTQGVTDSSQINSLYQKYFKRDATSAEIANWSKEPSSSLDSFLQSEQTKYNVDPATGKAKTEPKITSDIPEPTKIDLTDYKTAQEATQKAIDEAKTAREAYLKASSETGILTEEDKASIEEAGVNAGREYDSKIRAAQEEKRQQMAKDLIGAGQAGGLMSTQFAGVGAFAQTIGGTFVGAGGLLGRLEDQYSAAIADLEDAKLRAIATAEETKQTAIKTGKKEDLDRMYQAYQVMNDVVTQQNALAQQKFDEAQALYNVQRYEKEDATATIKSLADAGYTADDVPESYATAIERSANMPTGYVKQLLTVTKQAKDADTKEKQLAAATSLSNLLANTKKGGTVEVDGTKYTIMGTDEKGIQTTFETAKNGDVFAIKYDPSTGKTTSEKVGLNLGADSEIVNYKVNGVDAPFAVSKDASGKTVLTPLFSSNDSSTLVNSKLTNICPTGTTGTPYRNSSDPYYDQCGAGANDMYDPSVGKVWGNTQEEKAAALAKYGTIDPESAKINDSVVIDAGDSDHVAIINSVYNDPQTGEKMIRLSEQNWKKDAEGNGIWTHDRIIPADDASIVGITRIPLRAELKSGSDAGGISIGGVTIGAGGDGGEASIYAKGLISGDVKLTNVPQEVRAQAIKQAMASGWGGESDDGKEMTNQQYQRYMSITNKYQADTVINSALGADNYNSIADRVIADPGNAASQISMLYTFVKALDPNSAVKEGEVALAGLTQSFTDKFKTEFQKISEGKAISDESAVAIAQETKTLVEGWKKLAEKKTKMYRSQAIGAGVGDSFDAYTGRNEESDTETPNIGDVQTFADGSQIKWNGTDWDEIGNPSKALVF